MMREGEFKRLADATLERISQALEESVPDGGCELKNGGVLAIEYADGSRIIVNRHFAAQEIWLAAKSVDYHFGWDGVHWINARDGSEFLPLCRGW
jgi:CyaY protein